MGVKTMVLCVVALAVQVVPGAGGGALFVAPGEPSAFLTFDGVGGAAGAGLSATPAAPSVRLVPGRAGLAARITDAGLIDDIRLYRDAAATGTVIRTGPCRPGANPWAMLDGDTGDASSWSGTGAPNTVEIQFEAPVDLGRVIVHPGYRAYASNPSTECSPKAFVVQGLADGEWRDLSTTVHVPRYDGRTGEFRVAVDVEPILLRRFRLWITALYDEGRRVHSPERSVVAPEDRSVVIRELEWRTSAQVAEARLALRRAREVVGERIAEWQRRFGAVDDRVGRSVAALYGESLRSLEHRLAGIGEADDTALQVLLDAWERTERWLAPWEDCEFRTETGADAARDWIGELRVTVSSGDTPHEFYPAKVALDLRVVEGILGRSVSPYTIEVVDLAGARGGRCRSRFDRVTPAKGTLTWTLADRTHTRFALRFVPRPDAPPETGICTLGDGDHFYFDEAQTTTLPGDMWTCVFLDWDRDGRQDAVAGSWNDFCHLYRNVGTAAAPAFSEREHFLIVDETEEPLAANPEHHACAFSMVMPVDFDGDGLIDIITSTEDHGGATINRAVDLFRNVGSPTHPVFAPRQPMSRLNSLLNAQHDVKLNAVDLTGNGQLDVVTSTDPGTCVFYRSFLEEKPVRVRFDQLRR